MHSCFVALTLCVHATQSVHHNVAFLWGNINGWWLGQVYFAVLKSKRSRDDGWVIIIQGLRGKNFTILHQSHSTVRVRWPYSAMQMSLILYNHFLLQVLAKLKLTFTTLYKTLRDNIVIVNLTTTAALSVWRKHCLTNTNTWKTNFFKHYNELHHSATILM